MSSTFFYAPLTFTPGSTSFRSNKHGKHGGQFSPTWTHPQTPSVTCSKSNVCAANSPMQAFFLDRQRIDTSTRPLWGYFTSQCVRIPRTTLTQDVCMSVLLSVAFTYCVETSNHILKLPSGSHTIPVFPYQTLWHFSDENPLLGRRMQMGAIFNQYLTLSRK